MLALFDEPAVRLLVARKEVALEAREPGEQVVH